MTTDPEVEAIRLHRSVMHQPCCVEMEDGTRSRCDVDTLLAYIDRPLVVNVRTSITAAPPTPDDGPGKATRG